jgi:excisionase family DNA binding protein
LTVEEVAEFLHLSTRQVRRMIADDRLQTTRLGRAVRIHPEALAALLKGKGNNGAGK